MSCRAVKSAVPDPALTSEATATFSQWLEPTYDLNRRMLTLLSERCRPGTEQLGFHVATPLGLVLREAEPSDRQQLARCPFLLLNAGFREPSKWQRASGHEPESSMDAALKAASHTPVLTLARGTCLLAWHLIRTNPVAAKLVLGVSPECAVLIAQSGVTELQEIAARLVLHQWIAPRWHDRPDVWRRLIRLARTTTDTSVGTHGLQLLLGDLLDGVEGRS
jgi:hypothetical protein